MAHANKLSQRFKITHPFHPWSGQKFDGITYLHTWGEDRVYFHKEGDHLVSVPASWTDLVPEDPVVKLAAGAIPMPGSRSGRVGGVDAETSRGDANFTCKVKGITS
jgi:hypothetical protein